MAQAARNILNPPRLLSGNALLALGVEPGPQIGRMLEKLEDEQLEGRIRQRDEAEAWLKQQLQDPDRE